MDESALAAARLLLNQLGVRPEHLLDTANTTSSPHSNALTSATPTLAGKPTAQTVPTFAAYVALVEAAASAGSRRNYGPYWRRLVQAWGDRLITEPTALEIQALTEHTKQHAVVRRNSRGGRSAQEHMLAAIRRVYRHAHNDGYLTDNPALRVPKPRRLPNTRYALNDQQLSEIFHTATTTGNDRELDALILRLHIETACRRGGALALRIRDLDPHYSQIYLREKGETARWQPISPTLMHHLQDHTRQRPPHQTARSGKPEDASVLRYQNGRRLTDRRYDNLWNRIGEHLPWVAAYNVSAHWLRHTTLTWVERNFGYAVARAYAGHTDSASDTTPTTTYIRATHEEVARALAALTNEPHPLARASTQAPTQSAIHNRHPWSNSTGAR
ncbi:tyrosine-type recombinase/integrase [Nocardia exalbida]|uniref:tyrosine-type recombinase/integrase n=1 Tax=Nocardia exalbida TaxID=290231 RepID=UPI00030E2482|nr:tyrosine-type recombinase/integrase [Nocardia exalbida]